MQSLCRGEQTAEDFFADFKQLHQQANIPTGKLGIDSVLIECAEGELNTDLLQAMVNSGDYLDDYEKFTKHVIQIDAARRQHSARNFARTGTCNTFLPLIGSRVNQSDDARGSPGTFPAQGQPNFKFSNAPNSVTGSHSFAGGNTKCRIQVVVD